MNDRKDNLNKLDPSPPSASTNLPLAQDDKVTALQEESVTPNTQTTQSNMPHEPILQIMQLGRTVSITSDMISFFQKLFSPPEPGDILSQEIDTNLVQQTTEVLTGHQTPGSLMSRASEFINAESQHPALKSSEYKTAQELLVRTSMQARPEYFAPLELEETPVSSDTSSAIAIKFLREFSQQGSLDKWALHIKQTLKPTETAYAEFIDGGVKLLKFIGSDAVEDPAQDPLNKHVNPQDLKNVQSLYQWLEENPEHPDYDQKQSEFVILDKHIRSNRERATKESTEYIFSLLRRMQPEFADMKSMGDIISYQQTAHASKQYQKFEDYVRNFGEQDIFEPNQLRAFWENMYRNQHGQYCYKIICESFEENYKSSAVHQMIQQIWVLSLVDTIHITPQDAKSRMPSASVDGLPAPNFGYAMAKSEAYQNWITNSLVRACGDIIMDAFHFVVDAGRQLDIAIFLQRFNKHLDLTKFLKELELLKKTNLQLYQQRLTEYDAPDEHEYDHFMIAFERYLLEKEFYTPFVTRNTSAELIKVAGNQENLIKKASQILEAFKSFSKRMFDLSLSGEEPEDKNAWHGGLVLGIGFNGKQFNSPTHSDRNNNEIWLSFSESGRNPGGHLLLFFIKSIVTRHTEKLGNPLAANIQQNFEKYKLLIQYQVNQQIKSNSSYWEAGLYSRRKKKLAELEGFMSQLEQKIPFDKLDKKLKTWIRTTANWYSIPADVEIQIPQEIPPEEHRVQQLARELLFDAIAQRSFSKERTDLMPFLFLHWKKEIIKLLSDNTIPNISTAVKAAQNLEEIPEHFKNTVLTTLDVLVWQVHPDLKAVWDTVITNKFQQFVSREINTVNAELKTAEQAIKNINAKLEEMLSPSTGILANKNLAQKKLERAQQKLANLPKNPVALSSEEYLLFRNYFFENRSVSQCLEPVFARVLGHDRFFAVFISKKAGQTNITDTHQPNNPPLQLGTRVPQDVIAPCDKRCQYHALGHVYTGDILSYQSADHLDQMRQTHGILGVPDRMMTDITNNLLDNAMISQRR